jgi:hypothetical protein
LLSKWLAWKKWTVGSESVRAQLAEECSWLGRCWFENVTSTGSQLAVQVPMCGKPRKTDCMRETVQYQMHLLRIVKLVLTW